MTKRIEKSSTSRHIQIFEEDWEFLELHFGKNTQSGLGAGRVIRSLVHNRCNVMRSKIAERTDSTGDSVGETGEDKIGKEEESKLREVMARTGGYVYE